MELSFVYANMYTYNIVYVFVIVLVLVYIRLNMIIRYIYYIFLFSFVYVNSCWFLLGGVWFYFAWFAVKNLSHT